MPVVSNTRYIRYLMIDAAFKHSYLCKHFVKSIKGFHLQRSVDHCSQSQAYLLNARTKWPIRDV